MKRIIMGLLIGILFLTACGETPPLTQPTPVSSIDNPTSTPSPTVTRTSLPSATPTASITPLPTIPTFTPTFDVSTIVTVTPAPKAECPREDPSVKIDFLIPLKFNDENVLSPQLINDEKVLAYLNRGGVLSNLIENLQVGVMSNRYRFQDFTGDGARELLIEHFLGPAYTGYKNIRVYSCINGIYKSFSAIGDDWAPLQHAIIFEIRDLNKNGVPDIVISEKPALIILEWQGSDFERVELGGPHSLSRPVEIKDINGDSLDELIFTGKEIYYFGFNEDVYKGAPWRDEIVVHSWDGYGYIRQPSEYSLPEYRFQALQDADRFTFQEKYDQALVSYQNVIFDNKLNWWSPEMHAYEIGILDSYINSQATPTLPVQNSTEYPRLAAYAYYRIMLLHLVRGYESDASTVYNTLQEKFGNDPYARPYVEMASVFWEAFQSTQRMYDGCAAAIQYAVEHPEILIPLGSDYHGAQSHTYVPADVCPFR